jgi:hypothetical protein
VWTSGRSEPGARRGCPAFGATRRAPGVSPAHESATRSR